MNNNSPVRKVLVPWLVRGPDDPRGRAGVIQTVVYALSEQEARETGASMLGVPAHILSVTQAPGLK